MKTLAIAYHSEAGHSHRLAQYIAGGVAQTGVRARLVEGAGMGADDWAALHEADGSRLGLMATASPDKAELIFPADAETARTYGKRLAGAVLRWQG